MESLIKLECHTPPELDLCENVEPSVPQILHPVTQDVSKLSGSALAKNKKTKVNKNCVKTRELYVKLVRFDLQSTKKPINKIRVKDFGVFSNAVPQTKTSHEKTTHSKVNNEPRKPQQYTSLAAKLMHAHFLQSPALQSLLSDVLQLQKCCNSPISDNSIETEIRTIKEQYNLFGVDPTESGMVEDDGSLYYDYEGMAGLNVDLGENSISSLGSSTTTLGTNEAHCNVTGMETSNPDSNLINITLSNGQGTGLVFELDPNVAECPICSKSFKAFNSLKQHLKYCFMVNSLINTEPVANQNETPGQFVLKQELSLDNPVKIQQVFSAENMPSELRVASESNRVLHKVSRKSKKKIILPPKSISPCPEATEINIKQEDSSSSSPVSQEMEETQRKVSGPLYYCCLCDRTATSQKDLVLHCAATRKSKRKLANCQACRWKYPGEPFFLMHNQKFREHRALPLKCSTCKGLMYNHNMFVSHEVRKECTKPSETVVESPVNIPSGSDECKEVIVID